MNGLNSKEIVVEQSEKRNSLTSLVDLNMNNRSVDRDATNHRTSLNMDVNEQNDRNHDVLDLPNGKCNAQFATKDEDIDSGTVVEQNGVEMIDTQIDIPSIITAELLEADAYGSRTEEVVARVLQMNKIVADAQNYLDVDSAHDDDEDDESGLEMRNSPAHSQSASESDFDSTVELLPQHVQSLLSSLPPKPPPRTPYATRRRMTNKPPIPPKPTFKTANLTAADEYDKLFASIQPPEADEEIYSPARPPPPAALVDEDDEDEEDEEAKLVSRLRNREDEEEDIYASLIIPPPPSSSTLGVGSQEEDINEVIAKFWQATDDVKKLCTLVRRSTLNGSPPPPETNDLAPEGVSGLSQQCSNPQKAESSHTVSLFYYDV